MSDMVYNSLMENPLLFEKKFSILQEISNAIVTTDNINAVANLMLELAINYTNAEKGSLMLLNEKGELSILAARGIDIQLMTKYKVKVGEGIAGTVAANREPILVEDIERDEHFSGGKRDRYKTRSFISCPVMSKNKLLGVLNINDKRDTTPFTEDEFDLVKVIANQAAVALENAFLMTQLRTKAGELEEINRKFIESDIVKTEFLTRISHELRTPLNSIKGSVYYLQQTEKLSRTEQDEFHEIISNETNKLISIVENLLDFLRLGHESQIIRKSVISLQDVLTEVVNLKFLGAALTRKNLVLNIAVGEGVSDIVGDRTRVVQFFINLIEGLSHFLEQHDAITVTSHENDCVEVRLALSRRMPESVLPYFADSRNLFQSGQSEERLKLYLAWKIAENHRWKLRALNTDDTFVLTVLVPKSGRQKIEAILDTSM